MNKKIISLPLLLVFVFPLVGRTQDLGWFQEISNQFGAIVQTLIPIFIALALLVFVWGLVVFITNSGDDAAKQEGKNKMIWGVLALFVIVAIWGIINLLAGIAGVDPSDDPGATPTYPTGV